MAKPSGKRSVFDATTVDSKPMQVKIDPVIYSDMEALEERLKKMGGKLSFNRTRVVEEALRAAIDEGNAELDKLEKKAA